MDIQFLHDCFIAEIREKIPKKSLMSSALADILMIEKEAVYRRLRREVPFSFVEVVKICQVLGISFDNILGITSEKSRPFRLVMLEYFEPKEIDYILMDRYVTMLEHMAGEAHSEINYSGNRLPPLLWQQYRKIHDFHIFSWKYRSDEGDKMVPYEKVRMQERMWELALRVAGAIRNFRHASFILDKSLFLTLADEISFFESLNLITPEEKQELKEEILRFIDDMEALAAGGVWSETGHPVHIYISNVYFDANYACFESNSTHMSLINAFTLNSVASLDPNTYGAMKNWLQSSKRVSTLISQSGEMQRVLFFAKQREIINSI